MTACSSQNGGLYIHGGLGVGSLLKKDNFQMFKVGDCIIDTTFTIISIHEQIYYFYQGERWGLVSMRREGAY